MSEPSGRADARQSLAGVLAMSFVGGSVAVSHVLANCPLMAAQAIRYAIAAVVLWGLARARGARLLRPRGREWLLLIGVAATGLVLFNVAVVRGVAHAQPAVIAVAVACVPIVLGVIGPLLEGRRPHRRLLIAAVVVTAGSVLVEGAGHTDPAGVAWAVVALGCEAAFTLMAVPVLPRLGAWSVSIHSVWMGAVMFAVLGLVTEGPTAGERLTAGDWAAIVYLALMVTAVAFVLWYSTVAALGAARAGLLTGIAPLAAATLGIATTHRVPGPIVWAGIAVVTAGLAIGSRVQTPQYRPKAPPEVEGPEPASRRLPKRMAVPDIS